MHSVKHAEHRIGVFTNQSSASAPGDRPCSGDALSCTRTLRLKVRAESYSWLRAAATEVNQVWNWANEISLKAARPFVGETRWLSGFDLNNLSSGATNQFEKIASGTINRVNQEFVSKRRQFKKLKLKWRVSAGARKSLGWVPFKSENLSIKGTCLCFAGKNFRVFEFNRLKGITWRQGCFAEDACGDWWLCLPVEYQQEQSTTRMQAVGIDLGLKTIATTSDGETLEAGRWTARHAERLAHAQRRGHKKQAKRIHRKIARCRADALHKFSRSIVDRYQAIFVGDVSSSKLAKTKMAKSVSDSGWYMLKTQLQYKGQQAGRCVSVVNERNTTRACSSCGALTGPTGLDMLVVRQWICSACEAEHDRDVNAARNILTVGLRCRASVSGNESPANKDGSGMSIGTGRTRIAAGRFLSVRS